MVSVPTARALGSVTRGGPIATETSPTTARSMSTMIRRIAENVVTPAIRPRAKRVSKGRVWSSRATKFATPERSRDEGRLFLLGDGRRGLQRDDGRGLRRGSY